MGKYQRDKGHNFEREVANALKPLYPDARRNLSQSRDGGDDVLGTPFTIECKVGKAPSLWPALVQARKAAKDAPEKAIVVAKRDFERPIVVMDFDLFLELLARGRDARRD